MNYNIKCPNCTYFETGIKEIQSFMMLAGSQGLYYGAQDFEYCPWCGGKLLNAKRQSTDSKNMFYVDEQGVKKATSPASH